MAIVVHAPKCTPFHNGNMTTTIFLGGSIEMGKAVNWQVEIAQLLLDYENVILFNPRRPDWDPSWSSDHTNPELLAQINWELSNIEAADYVIFYLDENTLSPISLMEIGYVCGMGHENVFVFCPDSFYRNANVSVICKRAGVQVFNDKEDFFKKILSVCKVPGIRK